MAGEARPAGPTSPTIDSSERERLAGRLRALEQLGPALSAVTDVQMVATTVVDILNTLPDTALANAYVWMIRGLELVLIGAPSAGSELEAFQSMALDEELPGPVAARRRQALWIENRDQLDAAFPRLRDFDMNAAAVAVVPIVSSDHVIGVLALSYKDERCFLDDEQRFLTAVAAQAAAAVERGRLQRITDDTARIASFLSDASEVLASSLDYSETLAQLVRCVVPTLADLASVHLIEDGVLRRVALAHRDKGLEADILATVGVEGHPSVLAFLSQVLDDGLPVFLTDAQVALAEHSAIAAETASLIEPLLPRSAILLPLIAHERRIGVLSLIRLEPSELFNRDDQLVAAELARRAAVALDNALMHQLLQDAQRVTEFLLQATKVLNNADSYRDTLEDLAALAVPLLGDLCLIDVVDDTGRIERLVGHHADPSRQELADVLRQRYPPELSGAHPSIDVISSGVSRWSEVMSDEFLRSTCRDEEHFRLVKELDFTSYLCVPLSSSDGVIGCLTLISAGSGRRHRKADLAMAEELADQVAAVVGQARRTDRDRSASHSLQARLLPDHLPAVAGIELGVRYLPGTLHAEVGGDFYDVVVLPTGRVNFVIGDVAGHDYAAAAEMGQLRATVRILTGQFRRPGTVIEALQESWAMLGFERIATAVVGRLDPRNGAIEIASAGHPPPLLLSDGTARFIDLRPSSPLGAPATAVHEWHGNLHHGDALLLYTDGVIEDRNRSFSEGMDELIRVAPSFGGQVERLCDLALSILGEQRADDAAVLGMVRTGPGNRTIG